MKKIFLALLITIGCNAAFAGEEKNSENKLLGYWKFDEGTGSTISDCSGNNHTGEIQNDMRAVEWIDGKKGKALKFAGTRSGNKSGCLLIPNFDYDLSKGMTVEVWIKIDKDASAEGLYEIVTNSKDNCGVGFRLYYNWKIFTFLSGAGGSQAETWGAKFSPANPQFGTWTHIAATYDGSVYKLYINGEEVANSPEKQPFTNGNKFLYIGSAHKGASYGFQGIIDELKIYNYPLPSTEIIQNARLDF